MEDLEILVGKESNINQMRTVKNMKTDTPNQDKTPLLGIESTGLFADFVRRHALAVDDLTQEQLAEAIRQAMPDFRRYIYANAQSVVYLPGSEAEKWRTLYHELLWAVESNHEGESRHETALRYIREREDAR